MPKMTEGEAATAKVTAQTKTLQALLNRRSVSPKRLTTPAPDEATLDTLLLAAARAPDHGGLHPWRVMAFSKAERPFLAAVFEREKKRRDPQASASDLARAREHALCPPCLLAFVVCPQPKAQARGIPLEEQWLSAGGALCNLLNAAHLLGWGGIILSGPRCQDALLRQEIGLAPHEALAGFISLGTPIPSPSTPRNTTAA